LVEPGHSDVWLCRLQGDDKNRLLAVSRMLGVDVRGAQHILEHLPRLVARNLPAVDARKLAHRLRETGGVVLVCGTGDAPDFDAVVNKPAPPPAKKAAARPRARAENTAADAARAAQDAAMAHWPKDSEPRAWELEPEKEPPLVPRPVRHSAARVAWTLLAVLSVLGAGAGAYWQRYGRQMLAVSIAEPAAAPPPAPAMQPKSLDAGVAHDSVSNAHRIELAEQLATAATEDGFKTAAAAVAKALGEPGEPLRVLERVVGMSFELRETAVHDRLDALYVELKAQRALLVRHIKNSRVGFDRVALFPSADGLALVELVGTAGTSITNSEITAWLRALQAKRAFRLLGVGEHFVEGRFDTPTRDPSQLDDAVFDCPGETTAPATVGADAIHALERVRRGERFACAWP
jgi:hypothetical protein